MFADKFALILAMFLFTLTAVTIPTFALSPADKNWEDLERRGIAALDANQYGIAEPLLRKALAQSKDFRPSDMRLAKSFAELGRFYTIRGQFSNAALYLEAELKVKEQLLRNRQYECIPTMASLIQFYFNYDMQNKSGPLTEKMLSLIENRSKSKQTPMIEWAIACDAVGDRYYSTHNFALAHELFKTALNIKTTLLSSNHLSLANSYERMGNVSLEKNDPAQAEQYFSDALRITEKILPADSLEVHTRLDKLAKCLILQKKHEQAEKLYLQAQSISQNKNSKSDDRTSVKKVSTAPLPKADDTAIPFVIVLQKNPKDL
jgi:tetratricopeptide (TPR) repeat protein